MNRNDAIDKLIKNWSIPWDIAAVVVEGKSSVDLKRFTFSSPEDISSFIKNYGFDVENARDRRVMHAMIVESISFILRKLIPSELRNDLKPPKEIFLCDDPSFLLGWASSIDKKFSYRQAWACAVLRVIHTISHIEDVKRITNLSEAREQIFNRFEPYVWRDGQGRLQFGTEDDHLEIEKIDYKGTKTRDSIILKLLHKRANIAETIYDLMGVRIVTKELKDVLLVVKLLTKYQMVTFANTHPSRARNTMLDFGKAREFLKEKVAQLSEGTLTHDDFFRQFDELNISYNYETEIQNPHSSTQYRSIQLTSRQLLRIPMESFSWLKKLQEKIDAGRLEKRKKAILEEFIALVEDWPNVSQSKVESVFFPYEVQIVDRQTYFSNQFGEAAYDRYKEAQIKTARKRVLGAVLRSV